MEDNRITIDYVVHEADMARMERINKRLWIALIVVILLLAVSNAAWIYHESQFEKMATAIPPALDGGLRLHKA